MQISSPAFNHEGKIPVKYTCDGDDINPQLDFRGVPETAKALVLIIDDPDVPKSRRPDGMFVHWVVINMPIHTKTIAEDSVPECVMGMGTMRLGYQGPCPPDREHRYFFKLYALDKRLPLKEGATKEQVEAAMRGHILASSELMGRFVRSNMH